MEAPRQKLMKESATVVATTTLAVCRECRERRDDMSEALS